METINEIKEPSDLDNIIITDYIGEDFRGIGYVYEDNYYSVIALKDDEQNDIRDKIIHKFLSIDKKFYEKCVSKYGEPEPKNVHLRVPDLNLTITNEELTIFARKMLLYKYVNSIKSIDELLTRVSDGTHNDNDNMFMISATVKHPYGNMEMTEFINWLDNVNYPFYVAFDGELVTVSDNEIKLPFLEKLKLLNSKVHNKYKLVDTLAAIGKKQGRLLDLVNRVEDNDIKDIIFMVNRLVT